MIKVPKMKEMITLRKHNTSAIPYSYRVELITGDCLKQITKKLVVTLYTFDFLQIIRGE